MVVEATKNLLRLFAAIMQPHNKTVPPRKLGCKDLGTKDLFWICSQKVWLGEQESEMV